LQIVHFCACNILIRCNPGSQVQFQNHPSTLSKQKQLSKPQWFT
jgi:hypothetical protein